MIVWDTGPLIAAADSDDEHHARSVALMRRTPRPLLVPYPVLTEVCFMLEREKGTRAEAAFLRSISTGQISLIPLARQDLDRMVELVEKYSDFPLGAVDASVLAITERLDADAIATLDRRHFSVVRLTKPVALLP
ncbi:type II toxin-antitoxin system VapC family toxin [Frankia sp. QA3]|nr:PIN domain-containing protein [Frankia sp. QA3]EIV92809.1 putative nucleic acid-binding protein [Frankia sp. QA3]